jgi:tetratricopeptide (TPR) repeat protein
MSYFETYVGLCFFAAFYADWYGYKFWPWLIISFFITPVLVILMIKLAGGRGPFLSINDKIDMWIEREELEKQQQKEWEKETQKVTEILSNRSSRGSDIEFYVIVKDTKSLIKEVKKAINKKQYHFAADIYIDYFKLCRDKGERIAQEDVYMFIKTMIMANWKEAVFKQVLNFDLHSQFDFHFSEMLRKEYHILPDFLKFANRKGKVQPMFVQASAYGEYLQRDFQKALDVYLPLYRQHPNGLLAFYTAHCLTQLQREKEALKLLKKTSQEHYASFPSLYFLRAALSHKFGYTTEEKECLQDAADLVKHKKDDLARFLHHRLRNNAYSIKRFLKIIKENYPPHFIDFFIKPVIHAYNIPLIPPSNL